MFQSPPCLNPPGGLGIPAAAAGACPDSRCARRRPPGNVTGCGYNSGKPEERVPPGARSGGRPAGGRRADPEGGQRPIRPDPSGRTSGRERLDETSGRCACFPGGQMSTERQGSAGRQPVPGERGEPVALPGAPAVLPLVPGITRRRPPGRRPLPDAVAAAVTVRMLVIPDSAPPYDDEIGAGAPADPSAARMLPKPAGQPPAGQPPGGQPAAEQAPAGQAPGGQPAAHPAPRTAAGGGRATPRPARGHVPAGRRCGRDDCGRRHRSEGAGAGRAA